MTLLVTKNMIIQFNIIKVILKYFKNYILVKQSLIVFWNITFDFGSNLYSKNIYTSTDEHGIIGKYILKYLVT